MTSKSRRRSLQGAVFGASQPRQDFDGLGLGSQPKLLKTLTSSVTTAWGVDWDEVYIARDLMQNFFDANRGRVSEIRVDASASDVVISDRHPSTWSGCSIWGPRRTSAMWASTARGSRWRPRAC